MTLDSLATLPSTLEDVFAEWFQRLALTAGEQREILRPVLEVLVAAPEPLRRAELRDVLCGVRPSLCPPGGGGEDLFERRLQLLGGFLAEGSARAARGSERPEEARKLETVRLYHQSVADWIVADSRNAVGLHPAGALHISREDRGGQLALAMWRLRLVAKSVSNEQLAMLRQEADRALGSDGESALPEGGHLPARRFFEQLHAPENAAEVERHVLLHEACLALLAAKLASAPEREHALCGRLLAASGADVWRASGDGVKALVLACQKGHANCAALLLACGVNVGQADAGGRTALVAASAEGQGECISLLLDSGAKVRDGAGRTALMAASWNWHANCISLLLDRGAAVGQADKEGYTALMHASSHGHANCISLLLDRGAAVGQADKEGYTALISMAV
jgi:hypothetical protein